VDAGAALMGDATVMSDLRHWLHAQRAGSSTTGTTTNG